MTTRADGRTVPLSCQSTIHVLWAQSERYQTPNVITAWPDGLVDAWHEWYLELREKAIQDFLDFGDESDGPWAFWMTVEYVNQPAEVHEPIEVASRAF